MAVTLMDDNQTIDFGKIPEWWVICLKADSKMAEVCLRQRSFDSLLQGTNAWRCLMPKATMPVGADGRSKFFAKNEMVRFANGFDGMMSKVNSRDG